MDQLFNIFTEALDLFSNLSQSEKIIAGSVVFIVLAILFAIIKKRTVVPKSNEDNKTGVGFSQKAYQTVIDYISKGQVVEACNILEKLGRVNEAILILEKCGLFQEVTNLLVRCGSLGKAAWMAHKYGLFDQARDLYLRINDFEGAGNCYALLQDYEHALECFERCKDYRKIVLCSLKLELYQQAAMACITMKEYNEAINCFKSLVEKTEDISSISLDPEAVAVIEDYVKNVDASSTELIDLLALSSDLSEIVLHYACINNIPVAVSIALRSVTNIGSVLFDRSSLDARFTDEVCKNLALIFKEAGNAKVSACFYEKLKCYKEAADQYLKVGNKQKARECFTLAGESIPPEAMDQDELDQNEHSDTIVMGASNIMDQNLQSNKATTDSGTGNSNDSKDGLEIEPGSEPENKKESSFGSAKELSFSISKSIKEDEKEVELEQSVQNEGSKKISNSSNSSNSGSSSNNPWSKYRFFSGLDTDTASIIQSCLIKEVREKDQLLIQEDTYAMGIFFIVSGTVLVDGTKSDEIEFGDELIDNKISSYTLSCDSEVHYYLLSKDTLTNFLQNDMFSDQIKRSFSSLEKKVS